MPQNWERLSGVFSSLLDGTLVDNLGKFPDEEIRPFLPVLIANIFLPGRQAQNAPLVSKFIRYSEANKILQLLETDFDEIVADLQSPKTLNYPFIGSDDVAKIRLLLHSLIYEDQREPLVSIFAEENLDEVIQLLQIVYIKLPQLFNMDTIVPRALAVPNGYKVLTGLITNAAELLEPVLNIVKAIQVSDECAKGRERAALLDLLFCLSPECRWSVIEEMSLSRRDGLLAVRLACVHLTNDQQLLSYLTSQLIHRDSDTLTSQMISKSSARPTLTAIYDRILMSFKRSATKQNSTIPQTDVLRLIVFLQSHCVAKLSTEQMSVYLPLLCRSGGDDAHIIYTVAIIMSIQSLTLVHHPGGMAGSVDEKILAHFRWLRELVQGGDRPSLTTTLVYIASCVYSGKRDQLNSMFSQLLRIKVSIQPRHLDAIASILNEHFLKSEEIAQECLKLPVTTDLSSDSGSRLPINSVYLNFVKHSIDIAPWLEAQLRTCSLPIHNLLPELIERFTAMATRANLPGLSKQFVEEAFAGELLSEETIPIRVLAYLFLLCYRSNLDQLGSKAFEVHGPEIFTKLPARFLLSVVMSRTKEFGPIQPSLMRLATDICPYMLPTVSSIKAVNESGKITIQLGETPDQLIARLDSPAELAGVARRLQLAPVSDQVNCVKVVVRAFTASLERQCSIQLQKVLYAIYNNLQNFIPRLLFEAAAVEWLGGSQATLHLSDIYEHPSLLFRSDRRIFSSPPHYRCFIAVLDFFMQASKNNLQRKMHTANVISKNEADKVDRDTLSIAFDNTQTSLIVQLLIEVSDEKKMKDVDEAALIRRRDIRGITYDFLHQLFIADPQVLKLVIYQGLPLHMIRPLVEGVPSMYVAIDYLQEMLSLPDLNRRICGVCLMVQLSRKYRIEASYNMMDFTVNVLNSLMRYAESFLNLRLFLKITPTLAEVISIFPQLAGTVTALLMKVSAMAKNRLAMQPLVIRPDCDERRLMEQIRISLAEQVEAREF